MAAFLGGWKIDCAEKKDTQIGVWFERLIYKYSRYGIWYGSGFWFCQQVPGFKPFFPFFTEQCEKKLIMLRMVIILSQRNRYIME